MSERSLNGARVSAVTTDVGDDALLGAQPLISVAPNKLGRGVYAPDHPKGTSDWRCEPGSEANSRRVVADVVPMPLRDALARTYPTDAHYLSVVLHRDGAACDVQPRINKLHGGVEWVRAQGYSLRCNVVSIDVDNPGHAPHTEESLSRWIETMRACVHDGGYYLTLKGGRVLFHLDRWVEAGPTMEAVMSAARAELNRRMLAHGSDLDLVSDTHCKDWTRLMRMPHVVRADTRRPYASPLVDLSRMRPVWFEPGPTGVVAVVPGKRRAPARHITFASSVPVGWQGFTDRLAALAVGRYQGQRHAIKLALAGALLNAKVTEDLVPAIVQRFCDQAGWDSATAYKDACSTVTTWAAGYPTTGLRTLLEVAPSVGRLIDGIDESQASQRMQALNSVQEPEALSLDEAYRRMRAAIAAPTLSISLVKGPCGAGKSHAARDVARERAIKPGHVRRLASGDAVQVAPPHSKTVITVPTNELAVEYSEKLSAMGVATRRLFGPASVKLGGQPACKFHESATALAAAGQSIPRLLCEGDGRAPCPYLMDYDGAARDGRGVGVGCPAAAGFELYGSGDSVRVTVTTHKLGAAAVDQSTKLIVDEPPDLFATERYTAQDIQAAIDQLGRLAPRYACAVAPLLYSVKHHVEHAADLDGNHFGLEAMLAGGAESGEWVPADVSQRALSAVGEDGPVLAARAAFLPGTVSRCAPVAAANGGHVDVLRRQPAQARQAAHAARVCHALWFAAQPQVSVRSRVLCRVSELAGVRTLILTHMDQDVAALLSTENAVVLDANADVNERDYRTLLDNEYHAFRYESLHVRDACPVQRTVMNFGASRRQWLQSGKPVPNSSFAVAVEKAVRWVLATDAECSRCAGGCECGVLLVTFKPLAEVLLMALGEEGADRGDEPLVVTLRALLAPVRTRVAVRHYGALRGLDGYRDYSVSVTLGDPVPNLDAVVDHAALTGRPNHEARCEAAARAELEQAHGRLRTVQPSGQPGNKSTGTECSTNTQNRSTSTTAVAGVLVNAADFGARVVRQLHVGRVLPGGWYGVRVEGRSRVEEWGRAGERGRAHGTDGGAAGAAYARAHANASDMPLDELRRCVETLGGTSSAAETIDVGRRTMCNWLNGKPAISQPYADKLREAAGRRVGVVVGDM